MLTLQTKLCIIIIEKKGSNIMNNIDIEQVKYLEIMQKITIQDYNNLDKHVSSLIFWAEEHALGYAVKSVKHWTWVSEYVEADLRNGEFEAASDELENTTTGYDYYIFDEQDHTFRDVTLEDFLKLIQGLITEIKLR